MFLARCIGVSLAMFVILYLSMSLLVARVWRLGLPWFNNWLRALFRNSAVRDPYASFADLRADHSCVHRSLVSAV